MTFKESLSKSLSKSLSNMWTGWKLTQFPYWYDVEDTTSGTIQIQNSVKGLFTGIGAGALIAGGVFAYLMLKGK